MKIKSFIFVLYFCALILISVRAIELPNDGKQIGATEESNTKIVVDGDAGLQKGGHIEDQTRGHFDGGWGFWGSWGGWKGWIEWTGFGGGPKGKGGSEERKANKNKVGNEYKMKDLNGEGKKAKMAKIEGLKSVHGYQAHGYQTNKCVSMYTKEKFVKFMKIKIKDDQ
ncbi:unnamed protein product [Trifolium pratense]|uniref:Uncharacterized protein n=1 Tax=Trifolium pratense TaxID=57577 RepID=A0ACB0KB62_TRIPR|nr:unnamed protein product [Trifolium pratense]